MFTCRNFSKGFEKKGKRIKKKDVMVGGTIIDLVGRGCTALKHTKLYWFTRSEIHTQT